MQKTKKAYIEKESRELRIPLGEMFPTCPFRGGDLNIKVFIPMEDLSALVLDNQELSPKLRYCEFGWSTRLS